MEIAEDLANELSASTLAALHEFLADQQNAANLERDDPFAENWGKSQFWYSSTTAKILAEEVMSLTEDGKKSVACIACPSLFRELKENHPKANAHLLEYDERFARFGEQFTLYDYNHPTELPQKLIHSFQVVVADPPYLSDECLRKTAKTVSLLAQTMDQSHILLLTGAIQTKRAWKYLKLRPCQFRPEHKSKLGNEFRLFTNYSPSSRLGGWEEDFDYEGNME